MDGVGKDPAGYVGTMKWDCSWEGETKGLLGARGASSQRAGVTVAGGTVILGLVVCRLHGSVQTSARRRQLPASVTR